MSAILGYTWYTLVPLSHILCATFPHLIQYKLIMSLANNCHVFICIIEALATHFQHETNFSEHLTTRHHSYGHRHTLFGHDLAQIELELSNQRLACHILYKHSFWSIYKVRESLIYIELLIKHLNDFKWF